MRILIAPKNIIIGVIGLLICLYGISPYSMTNNIYAQFAVTVITYIVLFCLFSQTLFKVLFKEKYVYVYVYPLFLLVCYFNKWTVLGEVVFSIINTTIPLVLLVMLENEERNWIHRINKALLLYIAVICIFTLYMLRINPMICRLLAQFQYWMNLNAFELFFTGGFDFIYSLVLLSGVFFHIARQIHGSKIIKLVFVICYLLSCICIVASIYTTALLLLCLQTLCIFYYSFKNKNRTQTILFVVLTLLIILVLLNIDTLFFLMQYLVSSDEVKLRLMDLSRLVSGETLVNGDVFGRAATYSYSINTWLDNFWFGVGYNEYNTLGSHGIGGHSELLDHLGYYGSIGTLFFVYALVKTRNILMRYIREQDRYVYRIIFLMFIIEYIMNPGYTATFINTIFFIIPVFFYNYNVLLLYYN